MQTKTLTMNESQKTSQSDQKTLKLNGYSAIQSWALEECQEVSIFLEENTLLFILEGVLKIRFGELQYEITNNQIAFFKRDILIEYTTAGSGNAGSGVELVIVSFNNELIKEFTRLAELPDVSHEDTPPISVNSINARLLKYIDSLEPYFFEPEKVKESLVKIKLMPLLFYLAEMKNQVLEQLLDLREQFRHNITSTVEENIMNSISLNRLAGLSGKSFKLPQGFPGYL